jgi:hypothetical protein
MDYQFWWDNFNRLLTSITLISSIIAIRMTLKNQAKSIIKNIEKDIKNL